MVCGGTDVDVVERSILRLGAVDADKAGIFWFRLGLLQHLLFLPGRQSVQALFALTHEQFLQRPLPLHLQHCTISREPQKLVFLSQFEVTLALPEIQKSINQSNFYFCVTCIHNPPE